MARIRGPVGAYFKLVKEAADSAGIPDEKDARDRWRHRENIEAIGFPSIKSIAYPWQWDSLLLHFAQLADNDYWIERAALGVERRAKHSIRESLGKLSAIEGRELGDAYALAILEQMNLKYDKLDAVPAEHLQRAAISINKQLARRRREKKQERHV